VACWVGCWGREERNVGLGRVECVWRVRVDRVRVERVRVERVRVDRVRVERVRVDRVRVDRVRVERVRVEREERMQVYLKRNCVAVCCSVLQLQCI